MPMITIKNLNLQNTAILRNAYSVNYEKPVNQIWSAGFNLPLNDPAAKKIEQLNYAEIKDTDGEYIGLFRLMTRTMSVNSQGRYIKYNLSHVLSTLIDSSIEGYQQTQRGWTTRQVIEWILSFQDVPRWQLGQCDFDRRFEYSFENENGLASPLFSVTEPFAEDYMWTYDTTSYPWTINLIKPSAIPTCRVREAWNLQTLTVEENPEKVVNRIFAIGKGDGINNLNFKRINGGKNYVEDKDSQALYGLIEYIWKDERFTSEESLLASTQAMLEKFKRPIVTWKIKAVDLIKSIPPHSTMRIPKIDELRAGKVVQLWTTLFGTVNLRIVNEKKSDLYGDPGSLELEIGYIGGDVTTTIADLERKLEIYKLSSVGATNKDTVSFAENCDASFPLKIKFYCEEELKRINKILLTFQTEKYRAYSRATKGGGATVKGGTTSSGGAYVKGSSTQSGGGKTVGSTSQSGGGATSSANGAHRHLVFSASSSSGPLVTQRYQAGSGGILELTASTNDLYTKETVDNHTHTVPAHTHNFSVTVPTHSHDFTINIPTHTHNFEFSMPDHTHEIDYGIFEDSATPSSVVVKVDGNTVTEFSGTSADRLDIAKYCQKDDDGKVTRGWHEITITTNTRARFSGQCTVYGFIGSTEGEEL